MGLFFLLLVNTHGSKTKSVHRWNVNERGEEVGGASCCRRKNGKIKETDGRETGEVKSIDVLMALQWTNII